MTKSEDCVTTKDLTAAHGSFLKKKQSVSTRLGAACRASSPEIWRPFAAAIG